MFEIVLTQKIKKFIANATTPAEAVEQAMQEVKKDAQPFEPSSWTIKEKENNE